MTITSPPPNHHAHHPGFHGAKGLVAALSMIRGRDGVAALAAQLVGLTAADTVVDLGCGPGAAVRFAARKGATVTGIDPAPVMLRVARVLTRPSRRVGFAKGAAEALPVADASATVLWSLATVHHWPDLDAGLRETRRVLRPGGRFVAIERRTVPGALGLAGHGWTDDQAAAFAGCCAGAGFDEAVVERHDVGDKAVLTVLAHVPYTPAPPG